MFARKQRVYSWSSHLSFSKCLSLEGYRTHRETPQQGCLGHFSDCLWCLAFQVLPPSCEKMRDTSKFCSMWGTHSNFRRNSCQKARSRNTGWCKFCRNGGWPRNNLSLTLWPCSTKHCTLLIQWKLCASDLFCKLLSVHQFPPKLHT